MLTNVFQKTLHEEAIWEIIIDSTGMGQRIFELRKTGNFVTNLPK
jgi:hypothetical protein